MKNPEVESVVEYSDIENLSLRLNTDLETKYAEHFDPMRFAFIQSLVLRLTTPHHASSTVLKEKLNTEVLKYMADFEDERNAANRSTEEIATNYPEHAQAAEALLANCKFKQLSQLRSELDKSSAQVAGLSSLKILIKDLDTELTCLDGTNVAAEQELSLDEILSHQQAQSKLSSANIRDKKLDHKKTLLRPLRSMKRHHELTRRFNIDQIIARAINDSPQNPGPHNPQMLAIDALTQMRDLSPKYLRRFASYIDTLSWLDKPGMKLSEKNRTS